MDAQQLYDTMKKIQEPEGHYFTKNRERTFELLEAHLVNKERYGYTGCPCRLVWGARKKDRDILCPCDYGVPDIEKYGSWSCNLYISKDWNDERISYVYVPERRHPEELPV